MSQRPLVDCVDSDSEEDPPPSLPIAVRRSSRIQSRDLPWAQWPSEKIISTLEEQGIPINNGLQREDLILLASGTLGNPAVLTTDVPASSIPPAQPKQVGRKRAAKSSSLDWPSVQSLPVRSGRLLLYMIPWI